MAGEEPDRFDLELIADLDQAWTGLVDVLEGIKLKGLEELVESLTGKDKVERLRTAPDWVITTVLGLAGVAFRETYLRWQGREKLDGTK